MLRKFTVLMVIFALLPLVIVAQQKAILKPGGKTIYVKSNVDPREEINQFVDKRHKNITKQAVSQFNLGKVDGKIDTLKHIPPAGTDWSTTSFGIYGQEVFAAWFVAPAELSIKAVGINGGDNPDNTAGEVKLYKIGNGWTKSMLSTAGDYNLGYWKAVGNGYNDITPFEDEASDPKTWVAFQSGKYGVSPFAEDIWSDAGQGAPITLVQAPDFDTYQWIDMNLLGFEPVIQGGEIFVVILKNDDTQLNVHRFGLYQDNSLQYGLLKFHATERIAGDTTSLGWWMRNTLLNFAVIVDITGDTPPVLSGITDVLGTLSTDPIEITATIIDENPGGTGAGAGVKEAEILYSTDVDTTTQQVAMSASGDVYTGSIPGQSPGTTVTYKIRAVDVNDNVSYSGKTYTYTVFMPSGVPTLVVFNGWSGASGYPQDYYFAEPFKYDIWAYGPLSDALVNSYSNIIEITTAGPVDINSDVIKTWLAASSSHNYMLIGDEWLGIQSDWKNGTYSAGDFQYDVLGVVADSNDINYDGSLASYASSSTLIYPQQGSVLGDSMYQAVTAANEDSLLYNPNYELTSAYYYNFIDGVFVAPDVSVDYKALGLRGEIFNCGIHRTLPAGNKIVFLAFDPLSLDAHPPYTNADYVWYGYETIAPQFQALHFFDIAVDVKKGLYGPQEYRLSQNYPNPFNPSTTISYSIPERSNVSLKVYDVLGREVLTLVSGTKNSGTYEVTFDASKLSSGLYIYTLTAGNFSASRKMMLLK